MADNQTPPADQNPDKGKDNTDPKAGSENTGGKDSQAELAELRKENENLRGTQKALTSKIDTLTEGLKKVFGSDLPEAGAKDPLKLIENLNNQIAELKSESAKSKARDMVNNVIDGLTDSEGKPISDEVKAYLRKDIDVSEPDEEKIKEIANRKVSSLGEIFKNSGKFTSDKRPEPKGSVGFTDRPRTANEILEKLKK